jgi:hypothetical protein
MIKARSENFYPIDPNFKSKEIKKTGTYKMMECIAPAGCEFHGRLLPRSHVRGGSTIKGLAYHGYLPEGSLWKDHESGKIFKAIGKELKQQELKEIE